MEHFFGVVPCHVLDLYLVVVCAHSGFCVGRRRRWLKAEEISAEVTPNHVGKRIKGKAAVERLSGQRSRPGEVQPKSEVTKGTRGYNGRRLDTS